MAERRKGVEGREEKSGDPPGVCGSLQAFGIHWYPHPLCHSCQGQRPRSHLYPQHHQGHLYGHSPNCLSTPSISTSSRVWALCQGEPWPTALLPGSLSHSGEGLGWGWGRELSGTEDPSAPVTAGVGVLWTSGRSSAQVCVAESLQKPLSQGALVYHFRNVSGLLEFFYANPIFRILQAQEALFGGICSWDQGLVLG